MDSNDVYAFPGASADRALQFTFIGTGPTQQVTMRGPVAPAARRVELLPSAMQG
jgi:hypothetical protein